MKHFRWAGAQAGHRRSLLFQVRLDLQDVRSGYRCADTLHLKGEWLPDREMEWSRDMVGPFDPGRLEEIEPPPHFENRSAEAVEKLVSYMVRHHRLEIFRNYELGLYSGQSESRSEFVERCREALREDKAAEMKKLREIFVHRFFEVEKRLKSEISEGDMERQLKARVMARLDALFSEGREGLSRWFVRETDLIGEDDLVWRLRGDPQFQERIDALRNDLAVRFNRISAEYEQKAEAVETYEVPIQRSAVDVVTMGVLWE